MSTSPFLFGNSIGYFLSEGLVIHARSRVKVKQHSQKRSFASHRLTKCEKQQQEDVRQFLQCLVPEGVVVVPEMIAQASFIPHRCKTAGGHNPLLVPKRDLHVSPVNSAYSGMGKTHTGKKPSIFTRIIQLKDGDKTEKMLNEKSLKQVVMRHSADSTTVNSLLEAYQLGQNQGGEKSSDGQKAKRSPFSFIVGSIVITGCLYMFFRFVNSSSISKIMIDNSFKPTTSDIRFKDVCGCDTAKKELQDVVSFLSHPDCFNDIGARLPKGVLLVGPPGVGKTLLAKAVAGEAQVPFFQCSGSQFDEMFVGTGAARVRKLFQEARIHAPCVVFIDEFDSVGGKRVSSSIQPYANQTVNQLLAEMDGFSSSEGIIVLAATNRVKHLDSAIVRPGRFDIQVQVSVPDIQGRRQLFQLYLANIKYVEDEVDIERLAKMTIGLTGADISNIVNQAAIMAGIENEKMVRWTHIQKAYDKTTMGTAGNAIKNVNVNKVTAAHEAGHAVVAWYTKGASKVNQVTILPRGHSLGHTAFVADEDAQYGRSKAQLLAQLDCSMGGRLGEEIYVGADHVTTGASHDFEAATNIAKSMVYSYGMSDKFGNRSVANVKEGKTMSPETLKLADEEVKRLLDESMERARQVLNKHRVEHQRITDALLEYETLTDTDMERVMRGLKPLVVVKPDVSSEPLPVGWIDTIVSLATSKTNK